MLPEERTAPRFNQGSKEDNEFNQVIHEVKSSYKLSSLIKLELTSEEIASRTFFTACFF